MHRRGIRPAPYRVRPQRETGPMLYPVPRSDRQDFRISLVVLIVALALFGASFFLR